MGRFVVRRLLMIIPIVFGVATLAFLLMKLTPGDPVLNVLGDKASDEAVAALREAWGLDRPLFVQYLAFLGNLARGNLGTSYIFNVPVTELLELRLPATLMLMLVGIIFAVLISVPLALWVSSSKSVVASLVVRIFSATVQGMPTFFIGSLLISFIALRTGLFPVGGYGDTFLTRIHSLILPGIAVALSIAPMLIRSLIASLGESLSAEYVNFATAKGLPRRAVMRDYALRNGSISGVSILGIQVGNLVGGTLVIENVFAIPGVGSLLMQSVLARDFSVVQALTVSFGVLVVVVYAITDLIYAWLDPRARAGLRS